MAMPKYKIMLVGESQVGKTSIKDCFCTGQCAEYYPPKKVSTAGMKNIELDGTPCTVVVCEMRIARDDDEQFLDSFFSSGPTMDAIIMVYDICYQNSFERIPHHLRRMKEIFMVRNGGFPDLSKEQMFMLVGNKCDKQQQANDRIARAVSKEEGETIAMMFDLPFEEVSARENINIDTTFITLAKAIKEKKEADKAKIPKC